MAEAKLYKGKAIVAYVDGQAVDANGAPIEGAPSQPADTPREQQPTAHKLDPIQQLAAVLAPALGGAAGPSAGVGTGVQNTQGVEDEDPALPTVAELPDYLAEMTSVEEVKALQKQDKRKTAQEHYEARIAELKGA